ncbi:hypothetical protein GJ496_004274 [Pomphorhynchus laevis]|nr:hypothetical protein GJ496_004274 [Pomphorhynchus laevis]
MSMDYGYSKDILYYVPFKFNPTFRTVLVNDIDIPNFNTASLVHLLNLSLDFSYERAICEAFDNECATAQIFQLEQFLKGIDVNDEVNLEEINSKSSVSEDVTTEQEMNDDHTPPTITQPISTSFASTFHNSVTFQLENQTSISKVGKMIQVGSNNVLHDKTTSLPVNNNLQTSFSHKDTGNDYKGYSGDDDDLNVITSSFHHYQCPWICESEQFANLVGRGHNNKGNMTSNPIILSHLPTTSIQKEQQPECTTTPSNYISLTGTASKADIKTPAQCNRLSQSWGIAKRTSSSSLSNSFSTNISEGGAGSNINYMSSFPRTDHCSNPSNTSDCVLKSSQTACSASAQTVVNNFPSASINGYCVSSSTASFPTRSTTTVIPGRSAISTVTTTNLSSAEYAANSPRDNVDAITATIQYNRQRQRRRRRSPVRSVFAGMSKENISNSQKNDHKSNPSN